MSVSRGRRYPLHSTAEIRDEATAETIIRCAPFALEDDFLGARAYGATGALDSTGMWLSHITGAAPPTITNLNDGLGGICRLTMTNANQKQEAGIYGGDLEQVLRTNGVVFEARCRIPVLPTLESEMWVGLGSAYVEGPLSAAGPAEHVFFAADGSGAITLWTDDTTALHDHNGTATGVTLIAGQWAILRFEINNYGTAAVPQYLVKWFINDAPIAAATTFDVTTNAATTYMQPFLWCHKESGAGVGTLDIDYVRIWQNREA